MTIATTSDLLEVIRRSGVLESKQLQQAELLVREFPDPKAFARELVQRDWLTAWQLNHLGKGQPLILGSYVLLQMLAEGGMGQVFKARQQRLRRLAALKVIRKECLTSASAVERFMREAEAAARLSHPNIVTVYDAGEAGGTHFLAMEFVEGTDLGKLVKESGALPVPQACDYIRQAALGLQHAHEQGLVHRDIKPSNLMLNAKRVVKLMDLGLARLNPGAGGEAPTGLTASGAVMGTPDYIAPEQAMNAKGVDIRADIYSLGCSLYHLLTGQPPFMGESLTEKLLKHQLNEAERVEKLRSGLPKKLSAVVRTMMAKKPEKRQQTPAEVAVALAPFARPGNATIPPSAMPVEQADNLETVKEIQGLLPQTLPANVEHLPRRQKPSLLTVAIMAAVVCCGALAAFLWMMSRPFGQETKAVVAASGDRRPLTVPDTRVTGKLVERESTQTQKTVPGTSRTDPEKGDDPGAARRLLEVHKKLVPEYQKKIEVAWPGLSKQLSIDEKGYLRLDLGMLDMGKSLTVKDLAPLQGMKLRELLLCGCDELQSLTPVKGMPLTRLEVSGKAGNDLTAIKGMQLTVVKFIACTGGGFGVLRGMPLQSVYFWGCPVDDLTILKGMPITRLTLGATAVKDISPLKGLPLTDVDFSHTAGPLDLSPLEGMKLGSLILPYMVSKGMNLLRNMKTLGAINGLSVLEFWKKYDAGEFPQYKP